MSIYNYESSYHRSYEFGYRNPVILKDFAERIIKYYNEFKGCIYIACPQENHSPIVLATAICLADPRFRIINSKANYDFRQFKNDDIDKDLIIVDDHCCSGNTISNIIKDCRDQDCLPSKIFTITSSVKFTSTEYSIQHIVLTEEEVKC